MDIQKQKTKLNISVKSNQEGKGGRKEHRFKTLGMRMGWNQRYGKNILI